jgi:hypothetical protein
MKKILLGVFVLFFYLYSYGQKMEYVGKLNESIMSKLTSSELLMYAKCINKIGKDYEIIDWASEDVCEIIKKEPNRFKCQSVTINSKDNKVRILPQKGKITLGSEKFVFILKRKKTESIINLLIFY